MMHNSMDAFIHIQCVATFRKVDRLTIGGGLSQWVNLANIPIIIDHKVKGCTCNCSLCYY